MTVETDHRSRDLARLQARSTWFLGGVLLLASTVAEAVSTRAFEAFTAAYVAQGLLAAALLTFAFGLGRGGSITARRPLGTAAIAALAVWTVVGAPLLDVLYGGLTPLEYQPWMIYLGLAVSGALALIAVVQIARAGVLPAPWNRVPAWCLIAVAATYLLQLVGGQDPALLIAIIAVEPIVRTSALVVLAVLAIVLGSHAAPRRPVDFDRSTERD